MRFSDESTFIGPEYRPDLLVGSNDTPYMEPVYQGEGPEYRPDLMKKPLPKWVLPAAGLLVVGGLVFFGRR